MTSIPPVPTASPPPTAVRATGVTKVHGTGPSAVHALCGVDVAFGAGSFTAVMGPSGSGKSTLMHCLAGLDSVSSGSVRIGDVEISELDDAALTRLRRERIGFVFQGFNLIPTLTAGQNLTLPLEIAGRPVDRAVHDDVVRRLGLTDRLGHRPAELSGGQQQRVAIGRAMIARPDVVFADEPTGNLDTRSRADILRLLRVAADELGQTVVMVTHDPEAAAWADGIVVVRDGRIVDEPPAPPGRPGRGPATPAREQ